VIAYLVRFATLRPGVVIALALALFGTGMLSLGRASLDVFPEFSPVQVVIQTEAAGISAEQVETLVTRPIEATLSGVSGLHTLRSQSIPGLSVVTLVFADGTDIYRNRQLVAERMSALTAVLPVGINPTITPLTSSASTILGIGLHSKNGGGKKLTLMALRALVDTSLRPQLLAAEGVADINVFGGEETQWQVQLNSEKLAARKLTVQDVLGALKAAGRTESAGFIEGPNQRLVVQLEGTPDSLDALARRIIVQRPDGPVRFSDIGLVRAGAAPTINGASINGEPGVFLMVQGQLGANTKSVTQTVEKALADIAPLMQAQGVEVEARMFRPANFIDIAIGNVQRDIAIGSILVVAVLVIFLFNARTALISATAIPLSLLSAIQILQILCDKMQSRRSFCSGAQPVIWTL